MQSSLANHAYGEVLKMTSPGYHMLIKEEGLVSSCLKGGDIFLLITMQGE